MNTESNVSKWRKTKRGLITNLYSKLKARKQVDFDLNYLHEFADCQKFDRLFSEWEKSNYQKEMKPSIDRINHKKHYSKDNIQWLTWAENRYKQRMEVKSIRARKVKMYKDDILIQIFDSVSDVVSKINIAQGNISSCLSGKRKSSGGYVFKYVDENNRSHAIKTIKIKCNNCGVEFIPQNNKIKSCSRSCGSSGNKNAAKQ